MTTRSMGRDCTRYLNNAYSLLFRSGLSEFRTTDAGRQYYTLAIRIRKEEAKR